MSLLSHSHQVKMKLLVLMAFCILCSSLPILSQAQSSDEAAVRQILNAQSTAWNKGNLEAFMKGYWNSDSLIFIGKNGAKYGYSTTLENYKKSYPDTASMGKLRFNLIKVKQLSSKYFYVIGKWFLQRSIGDVGGSFTLLFQKIKGKWLIVADHSS